MIAKVKRGGGKSQKVRQVALPASSIRRPAPMPARPAATLLQP
jgi:hypothetical protein